MKQNTIKDSMTRLFQATIPLLKTQNQRLASASSALTLAGTVQLPQMANWLGHPLSKVGRLHFLERFFEAEFLSQDLVYQPFLKQFLAKRRDAIWYLLIDFGCTGAKEQLLLWRRLLPVLELILPQGTRVIVQGDTEFGSVEVMQFLRGQAWDFILAQAANSNYRHRGTKLARGQCGLGQRKRFVHKQ